MAKAFCFSCEDFVELEQNNQPACGHSFTDQQVFYEIVVGEIDSALKKIAIQHNIPITEQERKRKAFEITIDLVASLSSKKHSG